MRFRIYASPFLARIGLAASVASAFVAACGDTTTDPTTPSPDAGALDAAPRIDAAPQADASPGDSGSFDSGAEAGGDGATDAGLDGGSDASTGDSGSGDSGSGDSGSGDSGEAGADAAPDGGSVSASCKAALAANASAVSGLYAIDPDGSGPEPAAQVFCDMTSNGGGWTLGLLRNSVDTGGYATFGSGYVNVAALGVSPAAASSTTAGTPARAGWIDLNAFGYTELVLEGFTGGVSTFRSAIIAKSTLRIQFGQNGYLLYNDANGYYWCGGAASYTNDGNGQVNPPVGGPSDCKGHTSLGAGWDFGGAGANTNLTACGGGSALMKTGPASAFIGYPTPGGAHAIWVR